jgi:hypothetical protein
MTIIAGRMPKDVDRAIVVARETGRVLITVAGGCPVTPKMAPDADTAI